MTDLPDATRLEALHDSANGERTLTLVDPDQQRTAWLTISNEFAIDLEGSR